MPHASKRKPVFRLPKRLAPRKAPVLVPVRKQQEEEEESLTLRELRKLDYAEQQERAARFSLEGVRRHRAPAVA